MDAEIAPGMDAVADPPQDDVFVEKSDGAWLAFWKFRRISDHMPIVK
jgi:hypothetical protein